MSRTPRFAREVGLAAWCRSISTCPPSLCHCRCNQDYPQAVIDLWSLAHICWGIITGLTTYWIGWWSLLFTVGVAILFEILENSTFGIKISSFIWNDDTYVGDNMWNSILDVISNTIGGFITALIMIEAGWIA